MTDTATTYPRRPRGLKPFDQAKHEAFPKAADVGFTIPPPTYPIDKTQGVTPGMGGNGPDTALTVNGGQPCGDCVPNVVPKNVNLLTATMLGLAYTELTSNQVVTLYFTYQAIEAGIAWRPPADSDTWTAPDGLDQGVDAHDWVMWLLAQGLIEGACTIPLEELDGALGYFDAILVCVSLNTQAEQQVDAGLPWDIGPGDQPDPNDGHGITYVQALSPSGPFGWWTWGQRQMSTMAWKQVCPQGAIAILTKPEVEAKGFQAQVAQIRTAMGDLGGNVDPAPQTPPAPGPATPPVGSFVNDLEAAGRRAISALERLAAVLEGALDGLRGGGA